MLNNSAWNNTINSHRYQKKPRSQDNIYTAQLPFFDATIQHSREKQTRKPQIPRCPSPYSNPFPLFYSSFFSPSPFASSFFSSSPLASAAASSAIGTSSPFPSFSFAPSSFSPASSTAPF